MNEDDIATYLTHHPDFFNRHQEVLSDLQIPHPQGGGAVSLAERQISSLREKYDALSDKLAELLRFGERNDQINEKLYQLAVFLVAADTFPDLRDGLIEKLSQDFGVPTVTWRLWGWPVYPGMENTDPFVLLPEEIRARVMAMENVYCGPPRNMDWLKGWVLNLPPSLALVPVMVRNSQVGGALLFVSGDGQRFQPDMGSFYLDRLSAMLSAALDRVLLD